MNQCFRTCLCGPNIKFSMHGRISWSCPLLRSIGHHLKELPHLSAATRRCVPPPPAPHTYILAAAQNTPSWQRGGGLMRDEGLTKA